MPPSDTACLGWTDCAEARERERVSSIPRVCPVIKADRKPYSNHQIIWKMNCPTQDPDIVYSWNPSGPPRQKPNGKVGGEAPTIFGGFWGGEGRLDP